MKSLKVERINNKKEITVQPFNHSTVKLRKQCAFTLAEGATHVGISHNNRRIAFTLAEVLITIAIIGVVAVMVLPTLLQDIQERDWNMSAKVFEKKLEESMRVMNSQGVLSGYSTTEAFVDELGKHFKILNVCKNNELDKCFSKMVTFGETPQDITNIKSSAQFAIEDWGTRTVGLEFGNGVTGILAYNPSCIENPNSNEVAVLNCIALLYDTTGNTKPNRLSKDMRATANVKPTLANGCLYKMAGICVSKAPFIPLALTKEECNDMVENGSYGITANQCSASVNYYAGAVKACGGADNLPSDGQLTAIARELYGDDTIPGGGGGRGQAVTGLTLDTAVASKYGLPSSGFTLWGQPNTHTAYPAFTRTFSSTSTKPDFNTLTQAGFYAICVGK